TSGLHAQTLDARTGAALYTFGYGSNGMLETITDVDQHVTRIARDASGAPAAIIAPHGQTTGLTLDGDGYLATVTDPALATIGLRYYSGGLLKTYTDAKQQVHTFSYDAVGRLHRDEDPASGFKELTRTSSGGSDTVTVTTALGRVSTYVTSTPAAGGQDRTM